VLFIEKPTPTLTFQYETSQAAIYFPCLEARHKPLLVRILASPEKSLNFNGVSPLKLHEFTIKKLLIVMSKLASKNTFSFAFFRQKKKSALPRHPAMFNDIMIKPCHFYSVNGK